MIKDEKEAEDIVQETFIKVFKNIKSFKGKSSLYTCIYKTAQNTIRDRYKDRIQTIRFQYCCFRYGHINLLDRLGKD